MFILIAIAFPIWIYQKFEIGLSINCTILFRVFQEKNTLFEKIGLSKDSPKTIDLPLD